MFGIAKVHLAGAEQARIVVQQKCHIVPNGVPHETKNAPPPSRFANAKSESKLSLMESGTSAKR